MITQALLNIVNNANRYTDQGIITIRTSQKGNMVKVSVTDSGQGIEKEDVPKVFDRFFRVDPQRSGAGLGLFIAKEIVEAHKGKIWCESQIGKGSTFHFELPIDQGEQTHG